MKKREISPESAELFSTFENDCINHILTFLSFRDKRTLLQTSHHFKTVVEESPTWSCYCKGLDTPTMPQGERRRINLFDHNLDSLRWVFTPALETIYKPLAKYEGFSLIKELPKTTITIESIKSKFFHLNFFDQSLRPKLFSLINEQFSDKYCFRVVLTSPDGSMGDGIAFHDVYQDVDQRHFFLSYGDPNEGTIYTRYWKGQNFEETHYKEKYLVRQFAVHVDKII